MQKKSSITEIEQFLIDRVKAMRLEKGLSQIGLADKMKLSSGFIGDVENPTRRAKYNVNHINKLAIIFNCPFQDFFPIDPFKIEGIQEFKKIK